MSRRAGCKERCFCQSAAEGDWCRDGRVCRERCFCQSATESDSFREGPGCKELTRVSSLSMSPARVYYCCIYPLVRCTLPGDMVENVVKCELDYSWCVSGYTWR